VNGLDKPDNSIFSCKGAKVAKKFNRLSNKTIYYRDGQDSVKTAFEIKALYPVHPVYPCQLDCHYFALLACFAKVVSQILIHLQYLFAMAKQKAIDARLAKS
jgi:hypothetical protein